MPTLTVYPDAGSGATTVDGTVYRFPGSASTETFATIRAGAGTTADTVGTNVAVPLLSGSTNTNAFAQLTRGIYTFDTSPIAGGTVLSATFSIVTSSLTSTGLGNTTVEVVSSTPNANNNIATADYQHLGSTSFASIQLSATSMDGVSYTNWNLNSSGLANISVNGISAFGTRLGWDLNNSFTGTWVASTNSNLATVTADTAGTTSDPKLVVTYTQVTIISPNWKHFPKPPTIGGR